MALITLLTVPVFLVLAYFGSLNVAPESSSGSLGPVILDTAGQGYEIGDVVWLTEVSGGDCHADDVVLFDWGKVNPGGMGPAFALERFGELTPEEKKVLFARICCRIGHNTAKGDELKSRVY